MPMPNVPAQIKTYGDLKNAVSLWMNRDDDEFVNQIPNFINFAEKEIYRTVRIPKFEREIYLPIRKGMAYIPADCVEIKYVMKAQTGQVFRTTSIEELDWQRRNLGMDGQTNPFDVKEVIFAQTKGRLYFYPPISASVQDVTTDIREELDGSEVLLCYYRDTAELTEENESNEILTIAPELFLYLSMKHACVFVQDDAGADRWNTLAGNSTKELMDQAFNMEYSGSPLVIPRANNDATSFARHTYSSVYKR